MSRAGDMVSLFRCLVLLAVLCVFLSNVNAKCFDPKWVPSNSGAYSYSKVTTFNIIVQTSNVSMSGLALVIIEVLYRDSPHFKRSKSKISHGTPPSILRALYRKSYNAIMADGEAAGQMAKLLLDDVTGEMIRFALIYQPTCVES